MSFPRWLAASTRDVVLIAVWIANVAARCEHFRVQHPTAAEVPDRLREGLDAGCDRAHAATISERDMVIAAVTLGRESYQRNQRWGAEGATSPESLRQKGPTECGNAGKKSARRLAEGEIRQTCT